MLAAVALMLFAATTIGETIDAPILAPIMGNTPPAKHWVWLSMVGPRSRVFPIIYISDQKFETSLPEVLIVLSRKRYDFVAGFTHGRVVRPDCPIAVPLPPPDYAIRISERLGGHIQSCVVPQASACEI